MNTYIHTDANVTSPEEIHGTTSGVLDRETLDLHLAYIDNNLTLQRIEESTENSGEIVCLSRIEERN